MTPARSDNEAESRPVQTRIVDQHIAVVTLNRPAARNAVDAGMARALEAAIAQVEADEAIRVGIITGAGDIAFCAGADLKQVAAGRLDDSFTATGGFAGFVNAPRSKPWIAAVNGAALAGGFEIVLACDLVVASIDARFGLPEVRRGLIASAGGLYRLPRAVPKSIALEMIVTGAPLDAERAHTLGLVNRVVGKDEVLPEALRLAGTICANAPLAVAGSLTVARSAANFDDDPLRRLGDELQAALARTDDYHEGSLAFIEKRAPRWTGR